MIFYGNSADYAGGGMSNANSSPVLTNILFYGNTSADLGGGIACVSSSPSLRNVSFYGNEANKGGGMDLSASFPTLNNTIFYGNHAASTGPDIAVDATSSFIASSHNASDGTGGGINSGAGFVDLSSAASNTVFVNAADPDGTDNKWMTADDGLVLATGSTLIGAGTATGAPTTDIVGTTRPNPPSIGAYEGEYTNTWMGGTGTWNTVGNWSLNIVPTSTHNISIPSNSAVTASGDISVNDLLLEEGASLTVEGNVNNNGSVTLNSGSSLIAQNSTAFDLTYNRDIPTSNWYLVSPPVEDQDIDLFASGETLEIGTVGNNRGLGFYNTASDTWTYYQSGASSSGIFTPGIGAAVNLQSSDDAIAFSGAMNRSDVTVPALMTTGNRFNLLGNPYPSYINSASMLTTSTSALESQTLWIWDQSLNSGAGGYDTKVTADSFQLAPGQGFFVQANSDGGSMLFNESFQSHQNPDTFLRKRNPRPEIHLNVTDGTNEMFTKLYYINGTTTSFDNGYDGPMFGGVINDFAIYTHLVSNSNGVDYAIQSLPNSNYESMVVPVGINADAGSSLTFTADLMHLPAEIKLYLEDRNKNIITQLNDINDNYQVTLTEALNGIGRFYIYTTPSALSNTQVSLTNVNMYITNRNLTINGVHSGAAKIRLTDLLGKEVINTSFQGEGVNKIALPYLSTGIYIIQLETLTNTINKKLIIKE